MKVVIDPFCFKQFSPHVASYIPYEIPAFQEKLNELYDVSKLKPGYAPFCKHLFIENFTGALINTLEVNEGNQHLLRSGYEARTEKELPVLVRWFPKENVGEVPIAPVLDIILYSYEQIQAENQAKADVDIHDFTYEWGVVGIKPQDVDQELPMQPITVMRNSLGKEEGGSGVRIDREKYLQSVNYWNTHALIK